ncbi:MAG: cytochrome c biogenesis protein CcsA [Deltaproteobacteria bacterium]|nr:cytochrome c biogenesis protein CcsA [Deltaproteobacteria bacterium]
MQQWKTWTAAALAVLGAWWLYAVWQAPLDSVQGVIQKILYVHPPLAFACYAGFIGAAIGGALFLARGDERFDRFAAASAEVGVVFATLMLVTGPIWARGTWGKWWTWDPRLTVTLILYLTYVAYLLLRSFTEGSERAARFAAVYGILGAALIPLNYYAIELFGNRALHPDNLGRGSLGEGMGLPFLLGVLATFAAFAFLLVWRVELGNLRAARAEQLALAAEREDA